MTSKTWVVCIAHTFGKHMMVHTLGPVPRAVAENYPIDELVSTVDEALPDEHIATHVCTRIQLDQVRANEVLIPGFDPYGIQDHACATPADFSAATVAAIAARS